MPFAGTARFAGLAATLSVLLAGCGSAEHAATSPPASPSGLFLIGVHNDTPSTVKFLQCTTTSCAKTHERRTIAAGASTTVLGSNLGIRFGYLVEDTAGRRLGCVYMKFDHVKLQPTVPISSMESCE